MQIAFTYIKRDSPVHRLDPRVKWALLFGYSFSAAQTSNLWFILGGLLVTGFYYSQAHLKWSETRRPWIFVITITIIIVAVNYFISGGAIVQGIDLTRPHVLFELPFIGFSGHFPFISGQPLVFSVESLTFLLTQAMRNISIALLAIPIPYTTHPGDFGICFKGMGLPDKFSYAVDLSLRFLPTLVRDFSTTLDAQRARGFELDKLRGGLFGKIARMAPMIVPVVIGSIVGAEDIINAMELRCFGIGRRTWLSELHPRPLDRWLIALAIGLFVAVSALNILGSIYGHSPLHVLHTQGLPGFLIP